VKFWLHADPTEIPRLYVRWYWRGGIDERGPDGKPVDVLDAADDPVGTLALGFGNRWSDPIFDLSVEFAAPRWAHGLLGILAR
jgi:hypothetical protein